jgi:hypothetical protein
MPRDPVAITQPGTATIPVVFQISASMSILISCVLNDVSPTYSGQQDQRDEGLRVVDNTVIGQLRDAAAGPGDAVGSTDANGTVRLAGVFRKSRSNSVPILGTAAFQTVYPCKSAALGRCSETQLHDRRNPSDEAAVLDACVSATSPSPLFRVRSCSR